MLKTDTLWLIFQLVEKSAAKLYMSLTVLLLIIVLREYLLQSVAYVLQLIYFVSMNMKY